MSSKLVKNLDELNKVSTKAELSQLSGRSFLTTDRVFKSRLEGSFMIDQENAKQLERIQKRAQQLRQKEKRQRNFLKRLKKIYEEQLKQFEQFQKVTKQALIEKSQQLQMLSMENTHLKQERIQFCTLKDEKQILNLKNEQLDEENRRLSLQITALQQNYKTLKFQFEQQSELLEKGIRQNTIESESPAFAIPGSLLEVEQLTRDLEQQRKQQIDVALKKDEQNLRIQTDQINNCNFMLESLLKQIKKTEKQRQNEDEELQNKIIKSEHKLMSLTDQLMKKTQQLSLALTNAHKFEKDLKQRDIEIRNLNTLLKDQQQICLQKQKDVQSSKQQIEIHQDSQKVRFQTQFQIKQKKVRNFQKFQQKLLKLFEDKTLKEHSSVYDTFSNTAKEVFKIWNNSLNQPNETGDRFIQLVMKIIEANLIKLNEYFRQKASKQIERIQKMVGFINNANNIIQKQTQDDDFIKDDKDMFNQSTPQRFSIQPVTQHRRQQSQSSAKSYKKSIVLQQDMDNAVNYNEEIDHLKQQALQQQFSNMKDSQVILDTLNENGSQKSDTIKDAISQSSFAKSKLSQLSHAEQNRVYNGKQKSTLIAAKLKKKKKPQNV